MLLLGMMCLLRFGGELLEDSLARVSRSDRRFCRCFIKVAGSGRATGMHPTEYHCRYGVARAPPDAVLFFN